MEKAFIKLSKETAREFKREFEAASKMIDSLIEYSELFYLKESASDYFEEKMVRRVENVKYILDWVINTSKRLVEEKKQELKGGE